MKRRRESKGLTDGFPLNLPKLQIYIEKGKKTHHKSSKSTNAYAENSDKAHRNNSKSNLANDLSAKKATKSSKTSEMSTRYEIKT